MEFRSDGSINQRPQVSRRQATNSVANEPQHNSSANLDSNTKKLLSGAISSYLKSLYVKAGMQGKPTKADAISQINTILEHLPVAVKDYLSSYVRNINTTNTSDRKQYVDNFINLVLKKAFKNRNPYSKNNKEIINEKIKNILKEAFANDNKLQDYGFQAINNTYKLNEQTQKIPREGVQIKTVGLQTKATTSTSTTKISPDQKTANDKLKAIIAEEKDFNTKYDKFTKKLRFIGVFLNVSKAYDSLSHSAAENHIYSNTPISLLNASEAEQKKFSDYMFNLLKDPSTRAFKSLANYLVKQGISKSEADNMRDYFLNTGGGFPADSKSLLKVLLNPGKNSLFIKKGKKASEILKFRYLVFRGLTQHETVLASTMFDPGNPNKSGILIDKINRINGLIDGYNKFLGQHKDVKGTRFETKLTFNDATGGFVMFSTFANEYQLAEADRQAAALQGEGYNATTRYLQEIASGLTATIANESDSNVDAKPYLSKLTPKQIEYLGSIRLVEGGKTIADEYYTKGVATGSTEFNRGIIKAISSKLQSAIKSIEDKSQKVNVVLQDATEKRNIAATTLSKFLDKMYDVYKLTLQS